MTTNNEIWKPVTGYEGLYEVSNQGRVRSLRFGAFKRKSPKVLAGSSHPDGYRVVRLYRDSSGKTVLIHRLVIEAFLGKIPAGMQVCHQNGIPSDNCLDNLRVDTPSGNQRDRATHGTTGRTMTELDVKQCKIFLDAGTVSTKELAEGYGVSPSMIRQIATGKTWKQVPVLA
ncbi:hypothetical protein CSH63_08845 [Micromonospora tulbaghiae]|uniref:HNH endonuclease n=1 Tax=Micromonospora tulbaghiae TaxID=479978 RepID=A0A386WGS3_9ACTN|nr:NUMOD4 motif-containing HNH endonuclease [Micromonospora tulbaghiae]AYF27535.1 hypothetical protein CSH63_08845 [Micromonospora tulbaghiae]